MLEEDSVNYLGHIVLSTFYSNCLNDQLSCIHFIIVNVKFTRNSETVS